MKIDDCRLNIEKTFHVCIPSFHGEGCWEKVFAPSAKSAALNMAQDYDNGHFGLLNGAEITVFVMKDLTDKGIKETKKFICSGRMDPVYTAVEIEPH